MAIIGRGMLIRMMEFILVAPDLLQGLLGRVAMVVILRGMLARKTEIILVIIQIVFQSLTKGKIIEEYASMVKMRNVSVIYLLLSEMNCSGGIK